MSGVLERSLAIIEMLARNPAGLTVSAIATDLDLPVSAVHRLLNELAGFGYVRQTRAQGEYTLTIKLAALGLGFLGQLGVTDIAQPILDRLARQSGELIRLSVLDRDTLVWVGVAQGATGGLRYDPNAEQGQVVHLASSSAGHALLASMTDEEALRRVSAQGLAPSFEAGPKAPKTIAELLAALAGDRRRGYAVAVDSYVAGMAAMAVAVIHPDTGQAVGCLSIAGPAVRVTDAYMARMAEPLKEAAAEIAMATRASRLFQTGSIPHGSGRAA